MVILTLVESLIFVCFFYVSGIVLLLCFLFSSLSNPMGWCQLEGTQGLEKSGSGFSGYQLQFIISRML